MLDCSCNNLTHDFYCASARDLAEQVKAAKSFGNAISIVFRATHPVLESEPGELHNPPPPCQSCTPHIGSAIVEEGLRPEAEFVRWAEKRSKVLSSCLHNCSKADACANGFDPSPL